MFTVQKWLGLVNNASPYALPAGSMIEQINLQSVIPGQLTCRRGLTTMSFTSADSSSLPIRSAFRYQNGTGEHLVYQDSSGKIYSSVVTGTS
jgi:hypothetical protein